MRGKSITYDTGFIHAGTSTREAFDPGVVEGELLPGSPPASTASSAVAVVRERFGGRVGSASLPFEGVDWTPFDLIATTPATARPTSPAASATTSAPWSRGGGR